MGGSFGVLGGGRTHRGGGQRGGGLRRCPRRRKSYSSLFSTPGYGVCPNAAISHMVTPKDHCGAPQKLGVVRSDWLGTAGRRDLPERHWSGDREGAGRCVLIGYVGGRICPRC